MIGKLRYPINLIRSRLSYPLHLNFISAISFLFGGVASRVKYDNYRLSHYAYGVFEASKRAKELGLKEITVIEFGVANGRGLMAMAFYALKVQKVTGVKINVLGFDSGEGMPQTQGYKDHPEIYATGDFPLQKREKLLSLLPSNTRLIILDLLKENWNSYVKFPIGFISIDVDYYSSTTSVLKNLGDVKSELLLPNTLMYFDDIQLPNHNPYQGELLAIQEFNSCYSKRKIVPFAQVLRTTRRLKDAPWINQVFQLQVLDHTIKNQEYRRSVDPPRIISNKYLR